MAQVTKILMNISTHIAFFADHEKRVLEITDLIEEQLQKPIRKFKNHSRIQRKNKASHKLLVLL